MSMKISLINFFLSWKRDKAWKTFLPVWMGATDCCGHLINRPMTTNLMQSVLIFLPHLRYVYLISPFGYSVGTSELTIQIRTLYSPTSTLTCTTVPHLSKCHHHSPTAHCWIQISQQVLSTLTLKKYPTFVHFSAFSTVTILNQVSYLHYCSLLPLLISLLLL